MGDLLIYAHIGHNYLWGLLLLGTFLFSLVSDISANYEGGAVYFGGQAISFSQRRIWRGMERGVEGGYQRGDAFEIRSFLPPTNNLLNWATLQMLSHQRIQFWKGLKMLKHLNTSTHHGYFSPLWVAWIVKLHCYTRIIFGFSTLLYPVFVDRINTYKESMVNTENI